MIILIIILFIIILLYLGVRITFIYDKTGPKFQGCLKILILRKIKVYSVHIPDEDEDKKEDEDREHERHDVKKILELAKPCFGYFKDFLESFTKCIHVARLENHLIFGLDSYVDTAKYIGYIWSLMIILNSSHEKARLSAEPSFNGSVIDVKGDNELDINLLKVIPPAVRLISKKEVRTLIRGIRNG
ncbi:DUF2953 domain-containing protein [uncultured Methanobrevibacter sp.]|uniref:DUF2953 domain-containing protein n=1 Tax=uncultured Methanobrevibacter sp. TaxID=253161 RepID=UPI00261CF288|nr:DUF2953 domain-containing protein [uncultured Methanobrevibacter sp.]